MTKQELPKAYDFKATEPRIYEKWEKGGYFKPHNDPNKPGFDPNVKPFVISIPPPNVTGELHLGHAMFVSVEDLMIRYHRMKGFPTLWVPGSDHAGIATMWCHELGEFVLKHGEGFRRQIDPSFQRTPRLFQFGLRWLKRSVATAIHSLPAFRANLSNLLLKLVII